MRLYQNPIFYTNIWRDFWPDYLLVNDIFFFSCYIRNNHQLCRKSCADTDWPTFQSIINGKNVEEIWHGMGFSHPPDMMFF